MGADLERRTELDVHGGHEVFLLQQQQSLTVDLLRQELRGDLLTACEEEEEGCKQRKIENRWNEAQQTYWQRYSEISQ